MSKPRHTHEALNVTEFCSCGAVRHNQGPWIRPHQKSKGPDPLAQALAARYVAKSTKEERSEKAKRAAASRWEGISEDERKAYMNALSHKPRPSRVIQDRCPCGRYSRWLADKRGHKCSSSDSK